MRIVEVAASSPYDVRVASGILGEMGSLVTQTEVALVTDACVGPRYAPGLAASLRTAGKRVEVYEVEPGEESKSLTVLQGLVRAMAAAGFRRDCAVLALGGGVVSDLAGFVAATYLRGVAFYACPTTMLAMVDASVGGKTGVNLPEGKNLVGAFWQPALVAADVATLASLPARRFREGAVELVKHGFLADPELLSAPADPDFAPGGSAAVLERYIARSVRVKAAVVAEDEHETGSRAHLNLGHTLGHALEAVSDHRLSHGDAVAYGLVYAALLGTARGWHDFVPAATELLRWLAPEPLPVRSFEPLLPYMLRDKKNTGARQRFVLLEGPCRPRAVDDVSLEEQRHAWGRLLEVTG